MVEHRLKTLDTPDKNTYVVVTFNPWLYQDFDSARNSLLQLVGDVVLERVDDDQDLIDKAKGLLRRINVLRLVQLGGEAAATYFTGVPIGSVGKYMKKLGFIAGEQEPIETKEKNDEGFLKPEKPISLPGEIQEFRKALEELLDKLKITLVVFVDDLDRCLPKTAISTLESIRLLLFIKRSAFVIAADNDFIKGAVRVHFAGTGIDDDVATNYFDKLIQVPLQVPRLGVNESKAYIALLLMQREMEDGNFDKDRFDSAMQAVSERLKKAWQGESITLSFLEAQVGQTNTKMLELMKLADGLAPLLSTAEVVKGNPRLMKRFLNTVFLRKSLAEPQGITLDLEALAKWHLIERCAPELSALLANLVTSASDGRVSILHSAEVAASKGEGLSPPFENDHFVAQWLQLKPLLGEADLRPILHLSRDTDTRDFGADEMTQAGRQLRDALVVATSKNDFLTRAIQDAGPQQAGLAMKRAWQLQANKRTWRGAADVLMLVETCRIFPQHGVLAAELLSKAPANLVGGGMIPDLANQAWALELLKSWAEHPDVEAPVKRAIKALAKVSK